jgi:hypothetical protein
MGQAVLRVEGLPDAALDAAEAFYEAWLPQARAALYPPRNGEGEGGSADVGIPSVARLRPAPPPRSGEDLAIVFPSAPYDHRGWRLAAVQDLAREAAPKRVNAIAGDDNDAIAATLLWLASAPGVTGQLLAVDGKSPEKD